MTASSQSHFISKDERSSLQLAVARLRGMPGKEAAATAAAEMAVFDPSTQFSPAQVEVLAAELFNRPEAVLKEEDREILVNLLRGLPYSPGDAIEVLATNQERLLKTIHTRHVDAAHPYLAERLQRMIALASALCGHSDLKPWCDIKALMEEKERLESCSAKEMIDSEKDYLRFLNKVEGSGLLRRSSPVPDPVALLKLEEKFPNFTAPLQFLAQQAAFATLRGDASFHTIPILLNGPPGIGKTHFVMALAECLGVETEVVNMASQTCGFALSGMDRAWSSARSGLVFNSLLHGKTLSPIVILDEVDKANEDAKSDPLGPLYSLLEYRTARAFRDEYAGIAVDASHIFWLATSNNAGKLPAPLLSRFKVFEIEEPTTEQLVVIAEQVYQDLRAGVTGIPNHLPHMWRNRLSGSSVRVIRLALQEALGAAALRAVMSGERTIMLQDQDLLTSDSSRGKRMGFC